MQLSLQGRTGSRHSDTPDNARCGPCYSGCDQQHLRNRMSPRPRQPPRCSVCSQPLNVHQVVRGGVCDSAACRGTAARRAIERRDAETAAAHESIARAHLPSLLAQSSLQESDVSLLAVPAVVAALSAPPMERRERFRESVSAAVAATGTASAEPQDAPTDEPGDAAVRSVACGLCRGDCCRYGGDTAYIDREVVRRIRALCPDLDDAGLVAMFMDAVPHRTVEGSCILHGETGCGLPREHRSHVCNNYYCRQIRNWARDSARTGARPVAVLAQHENEVVRSMLVDEEKGGDLPDGPPLSRG